MSEVLHLQTRAYPLHYGSVNTRVNTVVVPGLGSVEPVPRVLGSQVYNKQITLEVDLTGLVRGTVSLPGTEIVSCHARILLAGTVLITYALRHTTDLLSLGPHELAAFDVDVNNALRTADGPLLARALRAVEMAGVFRHTISVPGEASGDGPSVLDNHAVRYNCHFLAAHPPWIPDGRLPDLVAGPHCRILLPYTYAWSCDPGTPLAEVRTMLEPADLAVAQISLLMSAAVGGRRIMAEVSRASPGNLDGAEFRRFLDRVWANYHDLDAYRIESAQEPRATYLAARETMGLDGAYERAERLLTHVSASLLAESSLRSQQLDARLNRVAARLTVVVATGLIVDLASFLLPDPGLKARIGVLLAVVALVTLALWFTAGQSTKANGGNAGRAGAPDRATGALRGRFDRQTAPAPPASPEPADGPAAEGAPH